MTPNPAPRPGRNGRLVAVASGGARLVFARPLRDGRIGGGPPSVLAVVAGLSLLAGLGLGKRLAAPHPAPCDPAVSTVVVASPVLSSVPCPSLCPLPSITTGSPVPRPPF